MDIWSVWYVYTHGPCTLTSDVCALNVVWSAHTHEAAQKTSRNATEQMITALRRLDLNAAHDLSWWKTPSMRNLLDKWRIAQRLDGRGRLTGRLRVPGP